VLVSVIVPLYNAESTIGETLDSIRAQTYRNLEIIVVDDCSTDNSSGIVQQVAQIEPRLKLVTKPINQGLNLARATGFQSSKGDFITFIDSDDAFANTAIETLVNLQHSTNADISMGGYQICDETLSPLTPQPFNFVPEPAIAEYSHEQMLRKFFVGWAAWPHNNNPTIACAKLYRRKILESVDWNLSDYRVGEDDFFSLLTFSQAAKSAVTNQVIYLVRASSESLSRSPNRVFTYQGKTITALQLCENFAALASQILGESYELEIGLRIRAMSEFYLDTKGMEFVRCLSALNRADTEELQTRISELEQQNAQLTQRNSDLLQSNTWKVGRLISAPLRALRRKP